MSRPDPNSIPSYYVHYVDLVKDDNIVDALKNNQAHFKSIFDQIPAEKEDYRYASNKWTTKEVVQHIIDTERIFNYRALCFARGESKSLPGFSELDYMTYTNCKERTLEEMKAEFLALRQSTINLYSSFREEDLKRVGNANGQNVHVNLIGFFTDGHMIHHMNIIKERYL